MQDDPDLDLNYKKLFERLCCMKVYISADIQGISGIVHPEQTLMGGKDYQQGRNLMIKEVNAAIEGALAGKEDEIVVRDAHANQFSILPEEIHPKALLVSGSNKPFSSMLEGIDETFACVFFIGYHARAGVRNGVLNHTYFAKEVQMVTLNGIEVGEIGINAALAGAYNVPVRLVTGDQAAVEEAEALLGNILTVSVKKGCGRYSAICRHPETVRDEIRKAAQQALASSNGNAPCLLEKPVRMELEFSDSAMADSAALMPHVERLDDRKIGYVDQDFRNVYKLFRAAVFLASTVCRTDY
jgi:D-amino peptidase